MRAGLCVDELRVDAHAVPVALHRAFEHVADAKLLADHFGVDSLALEGECRAAGNHEAVADARQVGGEVLGDAVGEILLARIAGEILEGQDDNREARRAGFLRRGRRRGLCPGGLTDFERIDPDRLDNVPELGWAEIADGEIEPRFYLAIGVLGETDRARRANPFEPRGDIDSIAHQIAVGLLDHVAEMDADAELDAAVFRHARIAFDHAALQFDRAAHRVDHAAELDQRPVAGAFDHAPVMDGDGRVDQVAAQSPEPRKRALLVRAREPAVADHIGGEDRGKLPAFGHGSPSRRQSK